MKLEIQEIRQKKNAWDCGIACVQMILKYYNINKNYEDLTKEITVYKNIGTYMPQLGLYFLEKGLKTKIITMNQYIFTKQDMNKTQKEILELIKKLLKEPKKERFKKPLEYYKKYLEKGGEIEIKIPTKNDIQKSIQKKEPLIVNLTTNFLVLDKPIFNLHYNTIYGIDEQHIYAIDPRADEKGGKQKYTYEEYMYAIHSTNFADIDNGTIMTIKK